MIMQAEAPSDSWLALPAVITAAVDHRLELRQTFDCRVRPVAFVLVERDFLLRDLARLLVLDAASSR